jgi:hypothetical protein
LQRRGGIILPATISCTAFEDERMGPRALLVTIASARALAARNRCPVYSPPTLHPDCYLSEDLPINGTAHDSH